MAKVLKELAVATGTYEDRNTGQTKNRYKNVGVLMEVENDRGEKNRFLMLERSFNPAGVPFKAGSDKILISMFDPRDNSQGGGNRQSDSGQSDRGEPERRQDFDDEIPF